MPIHHNNNKKIRTKLFNFLAKSVETRQLKYFATLKKIKMINSRRQNVGKNDVNDV